jgi:hypothetical protein
MFPVGLTGCLKPGSQTELTTNWRNRQTMSYKITLCKGGGSISRLAHFMSYRSVPSLYYWEEQGPAGHWRKNNKNGQIPSAKGFYVSDINIDQGRLFDNFYTLVNELFRPGRGRFGNLTRTMTIRVNEPLITIRFWYVQLLCNYLRVQSDTYKVLKVLLCQVSLSYWMILFIEQVIPYYRPPELLCHLYEIWWNNVSKRWTNRFNKSLSAANMDGLCTVRCEHFLHIAGDILSMPNKNIKPILPE